MELDSVRELKQALTQTVRLGLERIVTASAAFSLPALDLEAVPRVLASFALGVARTAAGDYRLAVRVQNRAFLSEDALGPLRDAARGEIDIRYVGRIDALANPLWQQTTCWPLRIGCSVGHYRISAGTLGGFVRDDATGSLCVLSNNHVLANQNAASVGDAILQPGQADGGSRPHSVIGGLTRFVPLADSGNVVDVAIAQLLPNSQQDLRTVGGGVALSETVAAAQIGDEVVKMGRTTGLTRGRVRLVELDNVVVNYPMLGACTFDGQIEIEGAEDGPFSQGGDSGSLVVRPNGDAVGLLFGGGDQGGDNGQGLTYANDLGTVLARAGASLAAT